ncbi:MAG: class I SAM-dependent methyltransferase [Bryobacteraceae bacterium]
MNCSERWLPRGGFEPRRYRPGGIGNWSGHLPFASDLIASIRPEMLVELGTHFGESYFGFCQAVAENNVACQCYAVDTWVGEIHAGFYDETVYQDVSAYNEANYSSFSYLLRTTFDEARANFADETIDVLHIDGLHTYTAVRHDFENWISAVKPGGLVLLHDISARHADFGVWRLWEELETRGECFSFPHSWGLGVFRKPGGVQANPFLTALFGGVEEERNHVRKFYALCAQSLEHEQLRLFVKQAQRTTAVVRVYPAAENGYSSDLAYDTQFKTREWEHVRVDLISGSQLGRFRIDITEYPGVIDVAGIAVRKAVNNEEIFRAAGAEELFHLEVGGTMTRLEERGNGQFCRYISTGVDPQLLIAMDPALADQPLVLDLWIRVDSDVTILLPMLQEQRISSAKNEMAEADERLRELENRNLESNEQLEVTRLELEATRREAEARQLELEATRREHEVLTAAHKRSQGEVYVLKRDLFEARETNEKLDAEIKSIRETVRSLSEESAQFREAHSELLQAHQALQQSHATLDDTLRGVLVSRSWRVTRPMRRVMEVFKTN